MLCNHVTHVFICVSLSKVVFTFNPIYKINKKILLHLHLWTFCKHIFEKKYHVFPLKPCLKTVFSETVFSKTFTCRTLGPAPLTRFAWGVFHNPKPSEGLALTISRPCARLYLGHGRRFVRGVGLDRRGKFLHNSVVPWHAYMFVARFKALPASISSRSAQSYRLYSDANTFKLFKNIVIIWVS